MLSLKFSMVASLWLGGMVLFSGGCATIADDYRIAEGEKHDRGYTSVSGNIDVGRGAVIHGAKTVSGDITIHQDSEVENLSSVSGNIRVGENVKVAGSVDTVAGNITIAAGGTVSGDVGTIAGDIAIVDSAVTGGAELVSGSLRLVRSRIGGTIRVKASHDDDSEPAEIDIGAGSEVHDIIVDRKARVHLRIHRSAQVGTLKGVAAEYYD